MSFDGNCPNWPNNINTAQLTTPCLNVGTSSCFQTLDFSNNAISTAGCIISQGGFALCCNGTVSNLSMDQNRNFYWSFGSLIANQTGCLATTGNNGLSFYVGPDSSCQLSNLWANNGALTYFTAVGGDQQHLITNACGCLATTGSDGLQFYTDTSNSTSMGS